MTGIWGPKYRVFAKKSQVCTLLQGLRNQFAVPYLYSVQIKYLCAELSNPVMVPSPLTAFCDGCTLKVCFVDGCAQDRLRDVGIREGAHLEMIQNSDKIVVRIEGCRIGIRRDTARDILAIPLNA